MAIASLAKSTSTTGPALLPLGHHQGKPAIRLTRPVYVMGSRSSARIHLLSNTVSKAHALVIRSNGRTYIRDLASRSKVYVNGDEVREAVLEHDDLIKIGTFTFQYLAGAGEGKLAIDSKKAMPAKLEVSGTEYPVPIEQRVVLIGRRSSCDINLLEESVSTAHAVIFESDGQRFIRDLGSRTGTFVNGVSTHQHQLSPNDSIRIGESTLNYRLNEVGAATVVQEEPSLDLDLGLAVEEIPESIGPADEVTEAPSDAQALEAPLPVEPEIAAESPIQVEADTPIPMEIDEPVAARAPEPIEEPQPLSEAPEIIPAIEQEEPEPAIPAAEEPLLVLPIEEPEQVQQTQPAAEESESIPMDAEPEPEPAIPVAAEESALALPTEELEQPPQPKPIAEESESIPMDAEPEPEPAIPAAAEEPPLALPAEELEQPPQPEPIAEEPESIPIQVEAEPEIPEAEIEEPQVAAPPEIVQAAAELDLPVESAEPAEPLAVEQEISATLDLSSQTVEPDVTTSVPTIDDLAAEALKTDDLELPAEPMPPAAAQEPPALDLAEVEVAPPDQEQVEAPQAELPLPEVVQEQSAPVAEPELELPEPAAPESVAPADTLEAEIEEPIALPTPAAPIEEPPLEHDPDVEILDRTEPTPKSALEDAADELALEALGSEVEEPAAAPDELTDTTFGRAVREFTGNEIGDLVEPAESSPAEAPASAPDSFIDELEIEPAEATAPQAPTSEVQRPEISEDLEPLDEAPAAPDSFMDELEIEPAEPTTPQASTPEVEPLTVSDDLDLPIDEAPAAPDSFMDELEIEPAEATTPQASAPTVEQPEITDDLELPVHEAPAAPVAPAAPPQPRPANPRLPWGVANQENFLGGVPIKLQRTPLPSEPPVQDETVKGLIKEIDTVAASAQAASTAPPPVENEIPPLPLPMPVMPPRPVRNAPPRPSRRNRELLIETEPTAPAQKNVIDTGFDGLAFSPMRDIDVFAQGSPELKEPSGNGDGDSHESEEDLAPRRPRGGISAKFDPPPATAIAAELSGQPQTEDSTSAHRSRVMPALAGAAVEGQVITAPLVADLNESEAIAQRRHYKRRMTSLICIMLLLLGASYWAINKYLAAPITVEGSVIYRNLGELSRLDQLMEEKSLIAILGDDATRRAALVKLHESPEISNGFLGDRDEYMRIVAKAKFTEDRPDSAMRLSLAGRDSASNVARMSALLQAVFDLNKGKIDAAAEARKLYQDTVGLVAKTKDDMDRLEADAQRMQLLNSSRPTQDQIDALKAEADKLNEAWNQALKAEKSAEAELEQLKNAPSGANAAAPKTAPAEDEKLKSLQASLDEMTAKVNAANAASTAQSIAAKKSLDSALDGFQKQISDAQGTLNGNPELAAFVSAAQQLNEGAREQTEDLIRKQETHFARLTELKQKLNDRLEKQRATAWENDQELRNLMDRQALVMRQYNAAVGGGLQKEADDKKTELDLVNNMIKARQSVLPGDAFYAEAIQELQLIIDSTKKDIEADRQSAEQSLSKLQLAFASGQSIEKLPQEQKQLATQIHQRLDTINTARKEYNQALDAGAADSDAELKRQIVTLQAAIDTRRSQLAAQNLQALQQQQEQSRLAAIATKQQELAQLRESESDASRAFLAKSKELLNLQSRKDASNDNAAELDAKLREKDQAAKQHNAALAQLATRKHDADAAIEPSKPDDKRDIIVSTGDDRRMFYWPITWGGIILVFTFMIFWTVHTAAIHAPIPSIQAADLRPVPAPVEPIAREIDEEEDPEHATI